ncbi:putative transporter [Trypanosoma grayi]|uniref:putative transporter n=1 Tax=Trypanosoma grayi TaxID=71804 RepID=UPI0004F4A44C|nr:putative transporter [Trypanosoma grayi]KEG08995.1 putative transporter [Trypanosoma grayi]
MYGDRPLDHPLGFLVAFGAFLVQFAVFGSMNCFVIFLDDMMHDETLGYPSQTELSFGTSISAGLSPVFGILSGFLSDRVHPRILLLIAMASAFAAILLMTFCAKTGIGASLYFAVLMSFSAGMMFTPTAAVTSTWFDKHRGAAIGFVMSGGGFGSVIFPIFCAPFLNEYGWRITFRLLMALIASGVVGALLVEKRSEKFSAMERDSEADSLSMVQPPTEPITFRNTRLQPKEVLRFISTPMFIVSFLCQVFYSFVFFTSIYIPVPMALAMGREGTVYHDAERIDSGVAGRVMIWFGIAQTVGAIASGYVSASLGCEAVFCLCCALAGISSCLLALTNTYIQLSFAVGVLAFFSSGMLAIYPSILARIFHGANIGTSMSLVFLGGCVGGLVAPPVQSAMQEAMNGDYTYGCILSCGSAVIAAYICFFFQWKDAYEMMPLKRLEVTLFDSI